MPPPEMSTRSVHLSRQKISFLFGSGQGGFFASLEASVPRSALATKSALQHFEV